MNRYITSQDALRLQSAVAKRRRRAARPLRDELRRELRKLRLTTTHAPSLSEGNTPGSIAYVHHPIGGFIRVGRFAVPDGDGWACKSCAGTDAHRRGATLEEAIRLSLQATLPKPGTTFRSVSEHGDPIDVFVETTPSATGWVDYTWTDGSGAKHEAMAPWDTILRWYREALRAAAPPPTTTDLF